MHEKASKVKMVTLFFKEKKKKKKQLEWWDI